MILGNKNDFSEKDVSIMSKETGVEYARLTIGVILIWSEAIKQEPTFHRIYLKN